MNGDTMRHRPGGSLSDFPYEGSFDNSFYSLNKERRVMFEGTKTGLAGPGGRCHLPGHAFAGKGEVLGEVASTRG